MQRRSISQTIWGMPLQVSLRVSRELKEDSEDNSILFVRLGVDTNLDLLHVSIAKKSFIQRAPSGTDT